MTDPASSVVYEFWESASVTPEAWRDKLAYLEVLANKYLPAYPELVRREKENSAGATKDHDPYSRAIHVFDLTGRSFDRRKPFRLVEYESTPIRFYFKNHGENLGRASQLRIIRCAEDAMRTPVSIALVAGVFVAQGVYMYVCTEMQYDPAARLGDRYSVVNHVLSICSRAQ